MKQIRKIAAAFSVIIFAGCATVPRDAGLSDVQNEVSGRSKQKIAIRQPAATDDESVRATLQGRKLDAETAVAVALANNPQVQIELAQLGLARADLIEASTIRNPIFSGEIRFPGSPAKPYEIALTQSILDIVQLPRRRAAGQAAFEAAKLRVASAVLGIAAIGLGTAGLVWLLRRLRRAQAGADRPEPSGHRPEPASRVEASP